MVSLVYLGKNDDDGEMARMCQNIVSRLGLVNVPVQETNANSKELPKANTVQYNEIWFCGHSRFVETNESIRAISKRTLGGFPIKAPDGPAKQQVQDIATFAKSCIESGGRKTIRLICCESAQQQRYKPNHIGDPPGFLSRVLGKVTLQKLTNARLLDQFNTDVNAGVSHLEGLILAMAELWRTEKNPNQPEFDICGLWGAGDIPRNVDEIITSFLQSGGSLQAQAKMDDESLGEQKKKAFAKTFKEAHCANKGLPDFFGYTIVKNLLPLWAPQKKAAEQIQ